MTRPNPTSRFQQLQRNNPTPRPVRKSRETEVDSLLTELEQQKSANDSSPVVADPIAAFRQFTTTELIPVFVDLSEKYQQSGVFMQMDASNFLSGGREISFEFALQDLRLQLHGTVTSDVIAFQEIRYSAEVQGELRSGPMLRLRQVTTEKFREFICEQLTMLVRTVMRRK